MNIITGEKLQDLCDVQISKLEHKKFESNQNSIDIDNFNFKNFNNSELVYCNISLINEDKPKLKESRLYEKLCLFKKPFSLVLHNADDSFNKSHIKYLDIPNCKLVYTQNMNLIHEKVKPLPIGIANSFWKWGDLSKFRDVLEADFETKSEFIYCNFTRSGGVRYEDRLDCYENVKKQNIPFVPNLQYKKYLNKLKKYKYCISPQGNGIDCYRTWEALYLKVVPICIRSPLITYFSKIFPIYILDDWNELNIDDLEKNYSNFSWDNYELLDFDNFIKHIGLI